MNFYTTSPAPIRVFTETWAEARNCAVNWHKASGLVVAIRAATPAEKAEAAFDGQEIAYAVEPSSGAGLMTLAAAGPGGLEAEHYGTDILTGELLAR